MVLNERTKQSLKKAAIYLVVFALGITVGVVSIKNTQHYKGLESTAKRLSLNTHMQLNHITLAGLDDPKALYNALYDECLYLEIIDRTGYWFLNDEDILSDEDFSLLYNTFIQARDIAEKLAHGEEVPEEDIFWLEVFTNTVHSSLSGNNHYNIFLDLFY